jgi:hypothetical protein
LIGELYNFQVISGTLIFDLLYRLINFGHLVPQYQDAVNSTSYSGGGIVPMDKCPPLSAFQTPAQKYFDPAVPSDLDPSTGMLWTFLLVFTCDFLG